jgi:hypothetical protein
MTVYSSLLTCNTLSLVLYAVLPLQVDIGYLRSLTKRRNYSVFVLAVAGLSLAAAVWTRGYGAANMKRSVVARSATAAGNMNAAYAQDIEGISKIAASMQPLLSLRALSVNYTDAANLALVSQKFKFMSSVLTTAFIVLLDSNGSIILAPDSPELAGTAWDPAFVVSSALSTGLRYTRSGIIKHSELVRFNITAYIGTLLHLVFVLSKLVLQCH